MSDRRENLQAAPKADARFTDGGFTLVEVLISMLIFSVVTLGGMVALTATLDAREAAKTRLAELDDLSAAHRIMADDFARMTLRENRDGLGSFTDAPMVSVGALEITRRGRPNPDGRYPRGDLMRVAYRVEDGALIRAFLPHENPAFVEPPEGRVVLRDVAAVTFDLAFASDIGLGNDRAAIDIRLIRSNGVTTRHVYALPDAVTQALNESVQVSER